MPLSKRLAVDAVFALYWHTTVVSSFQGDSTGIGTAPVGVADTAKPTSETSPACAVGLVWGTGGKAPCGPLPSAHPFGLRTGVGTPGGDPGAPARQGVRAAAPAADPAFAGTDNVEGVECPRGHLAKQTLVSAGRRDLTPWWVGASVVPAAFLCALERGAGRRPRSGWPRPDPLQNVPESV